MSDSDDNALKASRIAKFVSAGDCITVTMKIKKIWFLKVDGINTNNITGHSYLYNDCVDHSPTENSKPEFATLEISQILKIEKEREQNTNEFGAWLGWIVLDFATLGH